MRAPAISSCAEKIFFVDCVERMRRRSARREAATCSALLDLDALLATLGGVHRLGLGLVHLQGLALRGGELPVERLDRALQARHGVVTEDLRSADLVEDAVVPAGDEVEELALEPANVAHRHAVQLARGAQPEGDHLALDR